LDKPEARQHVFSGQPMIFEENSMMLAVGKIEYDLERARRERDARKTNRVYKLSSAGEGAFRSHQQPDQG
jgi:hypothetical protein